MQNLMEWRQHALIATGVAAMVIAGCIPNEAALGQTSNPGDLAHFSYDAGTPPEVMGLSESVRNSVTIQEITCTGANGDTVPAYLVLPKSSGKSAAISRATG